MFFSWVGILLTYVTHAVIPHLVLSDYNVIIATKHRVISCNKPQQTFLITIICVLSPPCGHLLVACGFSIVWVLIRLFPIVLSIISLLQPQMAMSLVMRSCVSAVGADPSSWPRKTLMCWGYGTPTVPRYSPLSLDVLYCYWHAGVKFLKTLNWKDLLIVDRNSKCKEKEHPSVIFSFFLLMLLLK